MHRLYFSVLHICFLTFFFITDTSAQFNLSGSLQNYTAFQTTGDYELISGRNSLFFELDKPVEIGGFTTILEITDNFSDNRNTEIILRRLYFDWYRENSDFRIGRQNITFGIATGGSVNDIITPLDLRDFFTREPDQLRAGITALNYRRYFGSNSLQIVVSPGIEPDKFPESGSRWFPVSGLPDQLPLTFPGAEPPRSADNIQAALRFSWRPASSLDIDLIAYNWAHPMPAYALELTLPDFFVPPAINLKETYKTSPMAGISAGWQVSSRWSLSFETLYVHNRLFTFLPVSVNRLEQALEDPQIAVEVLQEFEVREDGYLLDKSWLHHMVGLETEIMGTTVGLQGFLEIILDYEDRILPQELFPYAVGYAGRTFLRERLQVLSIGRYNIYGDDFWLQFQSIYEARDNLEFSLGTNLFGGNETSPFYGHFTFHQFRSNSSLFSRIKFYF